MNLNPIRRRLTRAAVTIAVAGGLLLASAGGASASTGAASAAEPTPAVELDTVSSYVLVPIRIVCYDIEDWWPDNQDEANFYYGSSVFYEAYTNGHHAYPPPVTYTGSSIHVELWEMDNNWTNHNVLGEATLPSAPLGEERSVEFAKTNDYRYVLYYTILPA